MKLSKNRNVNAMLWLSFIALLIMFGSSAIVWQEIPADKQVPTHWNGDGEVDGYGSKSTALLLIPIIAILTMPLFVLIPLLGPSVGEAQQSFRFITAFWAALLALLTAIHIALLFAALEYDVAMDRIACIGCGLLFLVAGNYMGKLRRNRLFGIRTKATLSSEEVWNKTNRLGGKILMVMGAGTILLAISSMHIFAVHWLFACCVVLFVWSVTYSRKLAKEVGEEPSE